MRKWIFAALMLLAVLEVRAQESVEDVAKGYLDGTNAGRQTGFLLPLITAVGSGPVLTFSDRGPLTNNQAVSALLTNTALSVGITWVAGRLFMPRPSREQREELENNSMLYASSWQRGYRESIGKRRFAATALGLIAGTIISGAIYNSRTVDTGRRCC